MTSLVERSSPATSVIPISVPGSKPLPLPERSTSAEVPSWPRTLLLLLAFLLAVPIARAANPAGYNTHWVQSGGGLNDEQANGVAVDSFGQVHVCGYFSGAASFSVNEFTNARLFEVFVALYDAAGSLLWVKSAGGDNQDVALGIAADRQGNSWVSGYYQEGASFSGVVPPYVAGNDAFVAKYDPDGTLLWVQGFGGSGDDRGYAVAVDGEGYGYVAGHFQNGLVLDGNALTNRGGVDVFLAKFSPEGRLVWARSAGGAGVDVAYGIALSPDGDVLLGGYYGNQARFGDITLAVKGNVDLFVARYSTTGDLRWVQSAGGGDQDYANAVAVDSAGRTFVAGTIRGDATFGTNLVSGIGNRSFVARYEANGTLSWVRSFGASDARGLTVLGDEVLVIGQFLGTIPFETTPITSAGNFDVCLVRFSGEGVLQWARGFGGVGADIGLSLAAGSSQSCYLVGKFGGRVEFDRVAVNSRGGGDPFVALLSPAPLLTSEPVGVTVPPGSEAAFSSSAVGAEPLSYQWFFNELQPVSGGTNATLVLGNVSPGLSGLYSLRVTNVHGTATSAPAFLNVFGLPIPRVRVNGVITSALDLTNTASIEVALEVNLPGAALHFTLDDSVPGLNSPLYTQPFVVTQSVVVRVSAFDELGASSQSVPVPLRFHLSPPRFSAQGVVAGEFTFSNVVSVEVELVPGLPGAQLSYTLDGSIPGTNAFRYSSPIVITQTTILRASASLSGMTTGVSEPVPVRIFRTYPLRLDPVTDGLVTMRPLGGMYPEGTIVQVNAQAARGWSFARWTGDSQSTNPVILVTMDRPRSLGAVFGTVLTTTNLGAGLIRLQPSTGLYARGEVVRATAVPAPGLFFALWGGAGTGDANPLSVTINGPVPTLSALFSPLSVSNYSVVVVAEGQGEVTRTPSRGFYPSGSQVQLEAIPGPGERFTGWKGDLVSLANPLLLTVESNLVLTAGFVVSPPLLLTAPQVLGGAMSFLIQVPAAGTLAVQRSANLIDWTLLTRLTNGGKLEEIKDPLTPNESRYYRALFE